MAGWQATNQATGKNYRYVIAYDQTTNSELGRTQVTQNVTRPDVARVYPGVANAGESGYQVKMQNLNWSKVGNVNDQIKIVSRYSDAANGEGHQVSNWSQPIQLDKSNNAWLDNFQISNNQLRVAGWHATNQALGRPYHFIILFDQTTNRELSRQRISTVARPDVAKVYSQVINAQNSGFSTAFSLGNVDLSHELRVISRYSNQANGEGQYVDYWFAPHQFVSGDTANVGYLDHFNLSQPGQLTVSGWHATNFAQQESNHYLILFDQTANQQVTSVKLSASVARPDVARVYPAIRTAGQSGFNYRFTGLNLTPGHKYAVVSRYSTSGLGNGNDGAKTDYWSRSVVLNQAKYSIDSFTATPRGFHVNGWMASDYAIGKNNAYIILLNNGKEVSRAKVQLTARPDVAKVYPELFNSSMSGFSTDLLVDPTTLAAGNLQLILRFTASADGNSAYSDQTSSLYSNNAGYYDQIRITPTTVTLSGWHAAAQVVNKPYQWLIVLNNNGSELYRQRITNTGIARPDVQRAYPYLINSGHAGFQVTMNIPARMQGHQVRFIHRYTDDAAGNGNSIDFYSAPTIVNLHYNMNANAINRYILSHHIGHAGVTVDHVIPEVTGPYSGTSDGKPNMVIVHETANPNDSIWGEINNEKRNYETAFVHAFVDANSIIEISNTDREAWGACYPANGRAVQFEQVEVYGANNFARELVNGAYYAALKMAQYGMYPQLETNGQGTLWSHHNVSQFLGHTDHVDPDGYWANRARYFGTSYTMSDFFELVKYEYAHL